MFARALLVLSVAAPAIAQQNADWSRPFPGVQTHRKHVLGRHLRPVHVSHHNSSTGHVLINTGLLPPLSLRSRPASSRSASR